MNKIQVNRGIKSNIPTLDIGEPCFTTDTNEFFIGSNTGNINITDKEIIVVDTLPEIGQANKIYILSTDFSMNYYDTSWNLLGGSEQIVIGATNSDITKLWLDTTSTTSPLLKWHNSTSWINISGTIDTSTLLDKATYKGSDDGIVKKADTLTGLISTTSQIDNTVNNSISVDIANRASGKLIGWNNGQNEYLDLTVAGIVGSTGSIIKASGSPVSIASGSEVIFTHPTSADDKIMINVQQQVIGSSVTDTHVDFSDSSKYMLQDSGKILIGNNTAKLDIYTKALLHMDALPLVDECNHIITNTGVTLDTTNKVFGSSSANFNGSSKLTFANSNDWNFGSGDFTISFRCRPTSYLNAGVNGIISNCANGSTLGFSIYLNNAGNLIVNSSANGSTWESSGGILLSGIQLNIFQHIEIVKYNSTMFAFLNGTKGSTIPITNISTQLNGLAIGAYAIDGSYPFVGNIDELRIEKGIARNTNSFTIPSQAYTLPYSIPNIPTYFKTTNLSDYSLTTTSSITSVSSTVTIPTNTSVKVLFSVDNGINWLYRSGGILYKYTGDLTLSWVNSNQWSEISTYFTNLSIATLTSDLSSLGITPMSLDFIWQLNSTDLTVTPSIGKITLVYQETNHTELASFGGYSETSVMFGVKRISATTLGIKNNTATTKIASVNVLLGTV